MSTLLNWQSEFNKWLPLSMCPPVWLIRDRCGMSDKLKTVSKWHSHGGVLLAGYEMYQRLLLDSKQGAELEMPLLEPGPDIVICDEGQISWLNLCPRQHLVS